MSCRTLSSPLHPFPRGSISFEATNCHYGRDVTLGLVTMMRSVVEAEMPIPSILVRPDPDVEPELPLPANKDDLTRDAASYLPRHIKEVCSPFVPSPPCLP